MKWYKRHRLEWILDAVSVYGFINREHLMRKFGISIAQASADLNAFQKLYPGVITYDLTEKQYHLQEVPD